MVNFIFCLKLKFLLTFLKNVFQAKLPREISTSSSCFLILLAWNLRTKNLALNSRVLKLLCK